MNDLQCFIFHCPFKLATVIEHSKRAAAWFFLTVARQCSTSVTNSTLTIVYNCMWDSHNHYSRWYGNDSRKVATVVTVLVYYFIPSSPRAIDFRRMSCSGRRVLGGMVESKMWHLRSMCSSTIQLGTASAHVDVSVLVEFDPPSSFRQWITDIVGSRYRDNVKQFLLLPLQECEIAYVDMTCTFCRCLGFHHV